MKELTLEEIKESQLKTMKIFIDYCEKNNLKYYLAFGTLLGAVRHKGYVSWDDDVDILMPREDYNYLIDYFNKESQLDRELVSKEVNKNYYTNYAKIIDKNTLLVETGQTLEIGVWIDIFPMDYAIENDREFQRHNKIIAITNSLMALSKKKYRNKRAFYKNIVVIILKIICPFYNFLYRKNKKHIDMVMAKEKTNMYGLFYRNFGIYGVPRIPKDFFDPAVDLEFEGEIFKAPKEYDKLLTWLYGDYMTLPPKSEQVSNHNYVCYWKNEK